MKRIKMTSEELRAFCSKQNLTYKELAEKIGYSESAIKNAANGIVSEPVSFAINLYVENLSLKDKLKSVDKFKQNLKDFLKD